MKLHFREAPSTEINATVKVQPHDHVLNFILVRFIPRFVTPNQVTLSRFVLTPVVFYLLITERIGWGLILFSVTAFTDAIDGTMARVRRQITSWGMVYDPVSDKLLIGGVMLILFFRHINIYLASTIIGIELLYLAAGLALKRHGIIKPALFWGKMKMLAQCFGVGFLLLGLWLNVGLLNDIAQTFLVTSIGFALLNLYKQGPGL